MTPETACKFKKFLEAKMPHKNSKKALHSGNVPNKCIK